MKVQQWNLLMYQYVLYYFLHECIVNLLFYQCVSFVQNGITGFVMYNINLCKCPYKTDLIQNLSTETTNRYFEK